VNIETVKKQINDIFVFSKPLNSSKLPETIQLFLSLSNSQKQILHTFISKNNLS